MKAFDYLNYPYASQRMTTVANRGMVATSQPLAAQAGLDILKQGGNAIDAAIATAAALTVVEPTSNGIGSDAFALVWTKGKLYGLNGSGPSPKSISIQKVKKKGHRKMPAYGWIPVTVPGAPGAWAELSDKFGVLPFKEILKPAIDYAEIGYPISPTLGKFWKKAYKKYKEVLDGDEFKHWFDTFAPNGKVPEIGEVWQSKGHANTLKSIGQTKAKSFYEGEIANQISAFSAKHGGFLTKEDLASYQPEWVNPISVNYRGYDVWEIPPNGQGLVALMALNILKGFSFTEKEAADTYHKQMEAMKLAFTDGQTYITEEKDMKHSVNKLLNDTYAEERRKLIRNEAITPEPGQPLKGGTVYLATADKEGNMVSFIQSNYMGFGSGLVVPNTGIALQNRGHNFSLNPSHDNALKGGKRTYHTIIPGFLTKNGNPVGPFGVMGGFMQPQGHVQVLMNTIDFHLNPQAALDAPRWQWIEGKMIAVESTFPSHIAESLVRKGHEIQVQLEKGAFGRGQMIWKDNETGTLYGGTESRTDGTIASY
ncbi:gamma-glutamyltranspeptidase / glutathione hydrolase [Salinibacillus kushneri]|uniref:Gamma-glutamyltranspeptidase / glutathione hydrolase n=1 Tax=Salinibacillus kushneri TaxID=237682 RepID=A0A1I0DTY6_9BACI|nr:gamma-glutamyltransferase family protein [Salinibacillus kushneri]SET36087.1 gamma-glutamyltranspeptidase / glutathione hydrolase [Salinibacillus kushneri]